MTPEVATWVQRRHKDLLAREFDNALRVVGPTKPLGAQGFGTRQEARSAAEECIARGLVAQVDCVNAVWWVYAWDDAALSRLLRERRPALSSAERFFFPGSPRAFVAAIRKRKAKPGTTLFDLIADAYGDKTGPGRTDVLPGVPREVLLDAYAAAQSVPDQTWIYFVAAGAKSRLEGAAS